MDQEDKICALCQWNKSVDNHFFCSHTDQGNSILKDATNYNDSCGLFEEREERKTLYDFLNKDFNKKI